jgi:hypothetical protein
MFTRKNVIPFPSKTSEKKKERKVIEKKSGKMFLKDLIGNGN